MANDVLAVEHASKSFGAVAALKDVSFALAPGEIRAVCGENGAGKSTLVKILMGLVTPDTGTIMLGGSKVEIRSPQHAQSLGLGMVAQELSLAPRLSIVDNIWLGSPRVPLIYRIPDLREAARQALELLGMGAWDLDKPVGALSIGQRQLVEIARLIARNTSSGRSGAGPDATSHRSGAGPDAARIMILDEPTATLNDREIERLIAVLKRLAAEGHSIIYISHRLGEVFELCDSVTVLRNGELIATRPLEDVTREGLVEMMLGRPFREMYPDVRDVEDGPAAINVTGLSVPGSIQGISFVAERGKILGIAGQIGSGASMVTRALAGLVPDATGEVVVDGRPLRLGSVPDAVAGKIVFLSEDRAAEGLFHQLAVTENLVATSLGQHNRHGLLDWTGLRASATERARRVGVDLSRLRSRAGLLSGGNQQKTLFGRALKDVGSGGAAPIGGRAGILLLNEPTRGIDVGARADIYKLMRQLCGEGYALVMTSSDLEELTAMSDDIITMYRGRVVARYDRAGIDPARILIDITHPAVADDAA